MSEFEAETDLALQLRGRLKLQEAPSYQQLEQSAASVADNNLHRRKD